METETKVSPEARQRLKSARIHDISFVVKQRIGSSFHPADVEMLVDMIIEATSGPDGGSLTKDFVVNYLRGRGRSPDRAEQLATALLK